MISTKNIGARKAGSDRVKQMCMEIWMNEYLPQINAMCQNIEATKKFAIIVSFQIIMVRKWKYLYTAQKYLQFCLSIMTCLVVNVWDHIL